MEDVGGDREAALPARLRSQDAIPISGSIATAVASLARAWEGRAVCAPSRARGRPAAAAAAPT